MLFGCCFECRFEVVSEGCFEVVMKEVLFWGCFEGRFEVVFVV